MDWLPGFGGDWQWGKRQRWLREFIREHASIRRDGHREQTRAVANRSTNDNA